MNRTSPRTPPAAGAYLPAIRMFLIFAAGEGFFSRRIIAICKRWSHMAVGFILSDGSKVYYESLFNRGATGPEPFEKLLKWTLDDSRRVVETVDLPFLQPDVVERKHIIAGAWVGHVGYAEWQIVTLWYFQRIGKYLGMRVPDRPRQMVCSEFAARLLQPELDLRDSPAAAFDSVTPGSAYDRIRALILQRNVNADLQRYIKARIRP